MLPFWHGALERTCLKCACNLESNARAVGRAHLSWDKDGEDTMKMLLLAGVGLIALGVATPASAADMAVKAPPPAYSRDGDQAFQANVITDSRGW